jgi:hypothetical protein
MVTAPRFVLRSRVPAKVKSPFQLIALATVVMIAGTSRVVERAAVDGQRTRLRVSERGAVVHVQPFQR